MGKASAGKKVARVARTGGGRTRKGGTSWAWPASMAVVVVLGVTLIVVSRSSGPASATPPQPRKDHWHAAIGFNVCGEFLPPITEDSDPLGIHTHHDGVIHIHPFVSRAAGARATLGVYLETVKATVTRSRIDLPNGSAKKNGDKCDGRAGKVRMRVWDTRSPDDQGREYEGEPASLRLKDSQLITVAFLPEGAEIPKPPSEAELDRLTDVAPSAQPPLVPEETPTETPAPEPGTEAPASPPGASPAPGTAPPGPAPPSAP
jgi:hypothetical protein